MTMNGHSTKPNPVTAYRELESITTSLLAACERGEIDAILAEIGRREEVQSRLSELDGPDIEAHREDLVPILERLRILDDAIEPKIRLMLNETGDRIRSTVNSRRLLDFYMKEPPGSDAKFYDRRG